MGSRSTGLSIGRCQYVFRKGGNFSLNINNAGCGAYLPNIHYDFRLGHSIPPSFMYRWYMFYESCRMVSGMRPVSSSQGACLVREYAHEVDQASDLENLYIVITQTTGEQAAVSFACPCQQANN